MTEQIKFGSYDKSVEVIQNNVVMLCCVVVLLASDHSAGGVIPIFKLFRGGAVFLTLRSSLMACFLAFLSSLLSSLLRGCVEIRGRSLSLILVMRSACLAVRPPVGRTSIGMPVLLETRIGFG